MKHCGLCLLHLVMNEFACSVFCGLSAQIFVGFYVWVVIRKQLYGPASVGDPGQRVDYASKIPSASNDWTILNLSLNLKNNTFRQIDMVLHQLLVKGSGAPSLRSWGDHPLSLSWERWGLYGMMKRNWILSYDWYSMCVWNLVLWACRYMYQCWSILREVRLVRYDEEKLNPNVRFVVPGIIRLL